MKFTVLGATGFIGSHLLSYLRARNVECLAPGRDDEFLLEKDLGHVIYCIGLTADFRGRCFDTVKAHVCNLMPILEKAKFESFLYLSSTRVYAGSEKADEGTTLVTNTDDADDLYNLSKMLGESLCLNSGRMNVRVARLSNVYGNDHQSNNFLGSVIRDAVYKGNIILSTTLESEKDYISVNDVVNILPKIAASGKYAIYNVASGVNVSNQELMDNLKSLTGSTVEVSINARHICFPKISIGRIRDEFNYSPAKILNQLDDLVLQYKYQLSPK